MTICPEYKMHKWTEIRISFPELKDDKWHERHCKNCNQYEYFWLENGKIVFRFAVDVERVDKPFIKIYGKER